MNENHFDTGMYVVDQDYHILNCNPEMKKMYPEVQNGDLCYQALARYDSPCVTCPLKNNNVLFFNPVREEWITANAANMEYPGHGPCYCIQFRVRKNIGGTKREIIRLEKLDEHLAELNASSETECVIAAYLEKAAPIFFANENMVALLGYDSIDELMAAAAGLGVNIVHPDDRERVKSDLSRCTREGDRFETAFRMPLKTGAWIWTILKGKLICSASGQLATLAVCSSMESFLTVHDALEKKHQDLLRKEMQTKTILENIPGCYHRCADREGFPFLYISDSFEELVGWTREEIAEKFDNKFVNLVCPEDIGLFSGLLDQIDVKGQGSTIYRIRQKEDGCRWVQDSTRLIDNGEERFYQCSLADITSFVQELEASRRDSESRDKLLAIASKEQILSEITKMIYSYNLSLNLSTGRYSLIVGTGLEEYVDFFRTTEAYEEAYRFCLESVEPGFRQQYEALASLDSLRQRSGEKGMVGHLQYSASLEGRTVWQEMNVFLSTNAFGEEIANLLCRDVTEAYLSQEKKENELRAIASKDQILSEITQMLYSYNLSLNLSTGCYSLIVGTGLEQYVAFFRTSQDYEKAYYFNLANAEPEFRKPFGELTSLENLRAMAGRKGFVGSLEYAANLGGKTEWHEMNVFIGTNEFGEDIANLLCRDVTEAHDRQEIKEKELRAAISKDQILSEITKMLYGYNLTLNLRTGKFGLIEGAGMDRFIDIFQGTDDYNTAFDLKMELVDPMWKESFRALASLKNLRSMSDRKGFIRSLEYAVLAEGRTEWHEINVFMGANEQGDDIANLLGRDVTEAHAQTDTKNQLEIARASNAAKTRFLSNMSHDIRTPINGIMGMLHIAKTHREDEARVDDCLNKIEISANYLLTLLNDILDLNKLESGKAVAEEAPFNMYQLINDIYSIIQPTAQMAGVRLEKACGAFAHPDVIGSPLHLRQILMNLISNSVKYSKENGTACIRVEEAGTEDGVVRYRFEVADDGIGMSEEFQRKMFDVFEQEYGGARTIHKGSGLGLSIVRMLIDLLGGELSVRSEKGQGSTFTAIIPFRVSQAPVAVRPEPSTDTTDCLAGVRILIVEDNDFNLEIARVILEEAGAIVTAAENGRIAVEAFEQSAPDDFDAILMDVMMPEMDGLEAARLIRRMDRPDARRIPIIAMTANAFAEDIRKSLEAGMNDHIAKPLDMAALAAAIARHVRADGKQE